MQFKTESGFVYEIQARHVRRVNLNDIKRADAEWVELVAEPHIEVGSRVRLVMRSLAEYGPDDEGHTAIRDPVGVTHRVTTPVTEILP